MKIEHFILLFLISFLVLALVYDAKQETLEQISGIKNRYDQILESASDDAAQALIKVDGGGNPAILKEEAVKVFFRSLYAGFGVLDDPAAQEELRRYIPLILILDKDGVYFWYHGTYEKNGTNYRETFSEKFPYVKKYVQGGKEYLVSYTFDDKLYLVKDGRMQEGTVTSLREESPALTFLSGADFEEERRTAIIDTVTEHMGEYINAYNRIGLAEGITYQFTIPYVSSEDWMRTLDDISFLAVFQGYPYGNFTTERYNQFEVASARTKKSDAFYITREADGSLLYHRWDCSVVDMNTMQPYDSKRACALQGAYPCSRCNP